MNIDYDEILNDIDSLQKELSELQSGEIFFFIILRQLYLQFKQNYFSSE